MSDVVQCPTLSKLFFYSFLQQLNEIVNEGKTNVDENGILTNPVT